MLLSGVLTGLATGRNTPAGRYKVEGSGRTPFSGGTQGRISADIQAEEEEGEVIPKAFEFPGRVESIQFFCRRTSRKEERNNSG